MFLEHERIYLLHLTGKLFESLSQLLWRVVVIQALDLIVDC